MYVYQFEKIKKNGKKCLQSILINKIKTSNVSSIKIHKDLQTLIINDVAYSNRSLFSIFKPFGNLYLTLKLSFCYLTQKLKIRVGVGNIQTKKKQCV